jgi:broad specificity phosphatase PhoE
MEIKTEVVNELKELSEEQKEKFAKRLASNFTKWDEDRTSQITTAKEIMKEVYLDQDSRKGDEKSTKWKSNIHLNKPYNIKKAIKAMLWREVYPNAEQMFDVRGTNEETEKNAKTQKAAIVDSFNKMKINKQYDLAVDSLLDIGEMIAKVDWVQKKKIVKRQRKDVGFMLQNLIARANGAGVLPAPMKDIEIPLYENARVETISPFMFVFDHSKFKLFDNDSWDSCIKIYKRFKTLDEVKGNKLYEFKDEWIDELVEDKEDKTTDNKDVAELRTDDKYGDMWSVLYAHGDFKIDGKIYKNYVAEVLAGKYLIRFEKNPMHINPFVYCALEYDPLTKRGISLLKSILDMCKEEEELTNQAFDAQKLTINPVLLAPEDMFDEDNTNADGDVEYYPGKIITFKENMSQKQPIPVQINTNGMADLLGLLDRQIADTSNVSDVMLGNIENQKRTATELSLADKGSSSQVGKILDVFYQDFTIPIVEKTADLLATFVDGVDFVFLKEKGKDIEYRITNEIRQAQYNYIYEDRNALHDKKAKAMELLELLTRAAQDAELRQELDLKEGFIDVAETIGYDNTDKYFKEATPAQQFRDQLKQIPQEMQAQVVQMFSQQLQQMMQQQQMQQQQAEMQAQAQKQVQMQQLRDNARAELEAQAMGVM